MMRSSPEWWRKRSVFYVPSAPFAHFRDDTPEGVAIRASLPVVVKEHPALSRLRGVSPIGGGLEQMPASYDTLGVGGQ
jgi:hypothetical protein